MLSWSKCVYVNVQGLHVSFTDVLESEFRSALRSGSFPQFSMKQVLRDEDIIHPGDMCNPVHSSLLQYSKHGGELCPLKYSNACYFVFPCNAHYMTKVPNVEDIYALFIAGMQDPCLASIEEGTQMHVLYT